MNIFCAPVIWLLRHAEAEDGSPDAGRRLTPAGERQAERAGAAIAVIGPKLQACLTSPKLRAMQTARLACGPLGVEPVEEPRLGGGPFDPEELSMGRGEHVLMVGHDPDFSLAVHRATGAQVRMKKGGLVVFDRGELILALRPSELALLARAR